ncbi:SprT family zinc-dependent metalloprotease [Williamsoniiplasma lucivorax]|uniref:Zinc metalloprotease n=1 Tax=Williamsoniiplasma lucivorax TaxID=209274 RepID=A0A2S5RFV5_9MOLU|nr:SprT family zinc-dependent metalloprotease [Williamsoniiplasma lucivorax]PPE06015.1 zinc metalloprotease [Williamsoniiplasma lucivorax]
MSTIKKQISVNGNLVNYNITYRDQKNIILRVKAGEIVLSAPFNTHDWLIEQMIYKNYHLINKHRLNYDVHSKFDLYASTPWIKILDQKVNIIFSLDNIHPKFIDDELHIKKYFNMEEQLNKIYTFLAKQYKNWFINRTSRWASLMNLNFKTLNVKLMANKWGVCYTQTQNIVYNTKLIHFLPEIIDYVIVHELTHLKHPNHSKNFWYTVEKYLPNYRELKELLNQPQV